MSTHNCKGSEKIVLSTGSCPKSLTPFSFISTSDYQMCIKVNSISHCAAAQRSKKLVENVKLKCIEDTANKLESRKNR